MTKRKMMSVRDGQGVRMGNQPARQHAQCACHGEHMIGIQLCANSLTAWAYVPAGDYSSERLRALADALTAFFEVPHYAISFEETTNLEDQPPVVMQ